jgi:hypothetical protein
MTPTQRRMIMSAAGAFGVALLTAPSAAQTIHQETPMTSAITQQKEGRPAASDAIRPFTVRFPDEELVDLKRRIAATRWPAKETVTDQSQGVQLATIQKLARAWADYDWRKTEAKLNSYPQFITEIDDLDIHFIHVRSKEKNALPVIVTHGWPEPEIFATELRAAFCSLR